jgi:tetratricopeptide (TPR) repeat protein
MLGLAQCGPQLVADRYSYVPTIPLALLGAAFLFRMFEPRNALFCGSLLGLGLGVLAREQARVWRDSETLWNWTVSVAPRNALAQTALAETLKERAFATSEPGDRRESFERALRAYEVALELETVPRTACNAAVVQLELAQVDAAGALERRARALELARLALAASERENQSPAQARLVAGLALYHLGRAGEAVSELQLHLDLEPASAIGWSHLGLALAELGRPRDASTAFARAVALRPSDAAVRWQWARALERSGDARAAREQCVEVLRLAPGHAGASEALERLGGG